MEFLFRVFIPPCHAVCLWQLQIYYCMCRFFAKLIMLKEDNKLNFVYFVTLAVLKRKRFKRKCKSILRSVLHIMNAFVQDVFKKKLY